MTAILQSLIHEASTELGSIACQSGKHQWASEGGRACPHDLTGDCSQAIYCCSVCGTHDYGEQGGPGNMDCERYCQHKLARSVAMVLNARDPFELAWWARATANRHRYHRLLLRALRRQRKPRLP